MAGVPHLAVILTVIFRQRQLRGDGDAVIALLSMNDDVLIAESPQRLEGKLAIRALGLLQAKNVWPVTHQKLLDVGMRSRTELMFQVVIEKVMPHAPSYAAKAPSVLLDAQTTLYPELCIGPML